MKRILACFLLTSAASAQIAQVNYTTTNNAYMNATPVASFQTEAPGITVQNGALLIGCARSSVSITGLSDGGSNTFTSIVQTQNGALNAYIHCFYKENAVGGSNLRFTFTVSSGTYSGGMVAQYTGIETASALDLYRTALTTTGTLTTTSFTTAQANELVFAYTDVAQFATTWSATSPLTLIAQSDQNVLAFAEEFAASQLTGVTRSMTNTDAVFSKVMILMTFKGSAASAPAVQKRRPIYFQ